MYLASSSSLYYSQSYFCIIQSATNSPWADTFYTWLNTKVLWLYKSKGFPNSFLRGHCMNGEDANFSKLRPGYTFRSTIKMHLDDFLLLVKESVSLRESLSVWKVLRDWSFPSLWEYLSWGSTVGGKWLQRDFMNMTVKWKVMNFLVMRLVMWLTGRKEVWHKLKNTAWNIKQ